MSSPITLSGQRKKEHRHYFYNNEDLQETVEKDNTIVIMINQKV